jgi:hypothetical protein
MMLCWKLRAERSDKLPVSPVITICGIALILPFFWRARSVVETQASERRKFLFQDQDAPSQWRFPLLNKHRHRQSTSLSLNTKDAQFA